jgi:Uma2 family endonuclease
MAVIDKIQLTDAQRATLDAGGIVQLPATWEEFEDFLANTPYRAEFHRNHIIVIGLAALLHEVLVARMIAILSRFYTEGYLVAGSNVGVVIPDHRGYFNPDVTVIKGTPNFHEGSDAKITNPYLLVEVLSEAPRAYDLDGKLLQYRKLPSLQQVVFVDRFERAVYTATRTETPNVWTLTTYEQPESLVGIDGFSVAVGEILAGV